MNILGAIRKYDLSSRTAELDYLLKIFNILGININVFTDFDIEITSDVLTLLFKRNDQIDMTIDGKKIKLISKLETFYQKVKYINQTYGQIQ